MRYDLCDHWWGDHRGRILQCGGRGVKSGVGDQLILAVQEELEVCLEEVGQKQQERCKKS